MERVALAVLGVIAVTAVVGCLALMGLAAWAVSSEVAGQTSYEYRCVEGVIESRPRYWGVGFGAMAPLDGDPVGATAFINCEASR